MQMSGGQAGAAVCGAGLPSPPLRCPGFPGKTMLTRSCLNTPLSPGRSGSQVCCAHRVVAAGTFPKRIGLSTRGREGAEGPGLPVSRGVSSGRRRTLWAVTEEPGWARRSQAQMELLAVVSQRL